MSLINKVLRDLDVRHAAEAQRTLPNEVRPLPAGESRHPKRMALLSAGLVALAAASIWGAWTYLAAPAPTVAAPVAAAAVPEAPPLPMLVIAPPEPVAEKPAPDAAPATPSPASEAPPTQASSLQLSITLRAPAQAVTAPAATRIEKQIHDDAHARADAAYRSAQAARQEGRAGEAVAGLRQALREEPGNANARQLLLSLLVDGRQWPEAEAALREGLDISPANAGWAMALARIQVESGQPDQAWATLQKYQAAGEGNADYQGFAGALLQRLQQPAEAIDHYQAALRLRPDARWWAGLGLTLDAAGRADEAREAFRQAQAMGGLAPEMAALVERRLK